MMIVKDVVAEFEELEGEWHVVGNCDVRFFTPGTGSPIVVTKEGRIRVRMLDDLLALDINGAFISGFARNREHPAWQEADTDGWTNKIIGSKIA